MNRRHLVHVVGLLSLSVALRWLLVPVIGIWGDFGFWAYDARMITQGQTPFVDFTGRSPLAVYTLAAVREVFGMSVYSMRGTMIAFWTLTGVPIYAISRSIRGHRAGLAALVAFLLTPYSLIYGMWLNSQSIMAVFAAVAVYLLVRSESHPYYAAGGVLFGIAYLSRRSVIMVAFGIGLYTAYRQYRDVEGYWNPVRGVLTRGLAMGIPFLATLFVGYAAVVGWYLPHAIELFRIDAIGLVYSGGNGTYPLIGVEVPAAEPRIEKNRIPIVHDLCQLCGAWTPRIMLKMLILSLPISGLYWWWTRDFVDRFFQERDRDYMYATLAVLALYGAYRALLAGFMIRVLTITTIALFAIIAYYYSEKVSAEVLYHHKVVLLWCIVFGLWLGYLYRNRRLHVYYLMDFWPYLSVLTGIVAVEIRQQLTGRGRELVILALALAVFVATATSFPFVAVVFEDNEPGFFTAASMDSTVADLEKRTEPGDAVLAAEPNYVVMSHARFPMNVSRSYQITLEYPETPVRAEYYRDLIIRLREGDIQYIVIGQLTADVLAWNNTTERIVENRYCRIDAGGIYEETNGTLYRYQPDCDADRRPNVTATRPPLNTSS